MYRSKDILTLLNLKSKVEIKIPFIMFVLMSILKKYSYIKKSGPNVLFQTISSLSKKTPILEGVGGFLVKITRCLPI